MDETRIDCLSCANSCSEYIESEGIEVLHCMINDGEVVEEAYWCKDYN